MRNRALALFLLSVLFAVAAPALSSRPSLAQSPSESAAAPTPCPTAVESAAASPSAAALGVGGLAAEATDGAVPESSGSPGPTPCPTPIDLAPFLTAELTMVNLSSGAITLDVLVIDPDTKQSQSLATQTVDPQGFVSEKVLPLPYTIQFTKAGAPAPYATCTVNMTDVQVFDFAAIDDAVAVELRGATPSDADELWTDTSSLCTPAPTASPSSEPSSGAS
jgi:hypothetical protein